MASFNSVFWDARIYPIDWMPRNLNAECLFVAIRGEGTHLYTKTGELLEQVHVSETAHRFAESFESTHGDSDAHSKIASALGIKEPPVQIDSQAKYGIVSRGEASLYIRLPNPAYPDYRECIWDHAAGAIVVEEAGGTVTDANGASLNFLTGKRMHKNRGYCRNQWKTPSTRFEGIIQSIKDLRSPTAGFLQTLKSNAKKVFLQGLKPRLQCVGRPLSWKKCASPAIKESTKER